MSDIFISYARADKERAKLLAEAFSRQGWSVWWDREVPPGKSFDETIENALNSARCVIVLWSKDSVPSRWVRTEAAEGAARGILVPVLIEQVPIPLEFKRIEAADLSDWHGTSPHFEFDQLLMTVASILGGSAPTEVKQVPTNTRLRSRRWWTTKLGLVTATAGIITATTGLIVALYQSGLFQNAEQPSTLASTGSSVTAPDTKPTQPQATTDQPITPEQVAETPARKIQAREFQQPKRINLFAPENGAHVLVASSDSWTKTIDGNEHFWEYAPGEAVYGFKDERPATFDTFTILITGTHPVNVKEFELLVGNDSPTGAFESIGKFQTQNVKLFKTPYQKFKFPVVTAKYLKVKTLSSYHAAGGAYVYEFQLFGSLN